MAAGERERAENLEAVLSVAVAAPEGGPAEDAPPRCAFSPPSSGGLPFPSFSSRVESSRVGL